MEEEKRRFKINIEYNSYEDMYEDLYEVFQILFESPRERYNRKQREYRANNRDKFVGFENNRKNKEERAIYKRKKNMRDAMLKRGEENVPEIKDIILPSGKNNISNLESSVNTMLEKKFSKYLFTRVRLPFIRNPKTKRALEFDHYCEELRLAVESNGRQHYEFVEFFQKTIENFKKQKYRDRVKKKMARAHGITILDFPYNGKLQDLENSIRNYIRKRKEKIIYTSLLNLIMILLSLR